MGSPKQALQAAQDALRTARNEATQGFITAQNALAEAIAELERQERDALAATDPVMDDPEAKRLIDAASKLYVEKEGFGLKLVENKHHVKNVRLLAMEPGQRLAVCHIPPGTKITTARATSLDPELVGLAASILQGRRFSIVGMDERGDMPILFALADAPYGIIIAPRIEGYSDHPGNNGEVTEVVPVAK